MAGKKGYEAARSLRTRAKAKRGGNAKQNIITTSKGDLVSLKNKYLEYLKVRNYRQSTLEGRRKDLNNFLAWTIERDLNFASQINKPILAQLCR